MAQEMVIRTSAYFKGVANPGTTPSKFAIFTGTDNLIGFRSSSELLTDLGFSEAVDDRVASLLVAGSGISLVYNDPSNTLTINATGTTNNILQNGNSFGTAVTIGSNDAFALNFETSGTTKGTIGTDGVFTLSNSVSNTSTIANRFIIQSNSDGTPLNGFGSRILFQGESSTTNNRDIAGLTAYWADVTDSTRQSKIGFDLVTNGGALTEQASIRMSGSGVVNFTLGAASPVSITQANFTVSIPFIFGNSGNAVTISSSSSTNSAIDLSASNNAGSVSIGQGLTANGTSGNKSLLRLNHGFAPTSGTATFNAIDIDHTINQTGGANGITRSLYVNPILTSVSNYRAIEITVDNSNAYAFYQSGSTTKNYFNGNVGLKIDTPAQALDVNGIVRIRSVAGITPTSLVGRDANGDVGAIVLGSGLTLVGDTLTASGGSGGSSINVTGIVVESAPNTFVGRIITGTANRISVTDGDGISANPTLDIAVTYTGQTSIITLGTITTGIWQGTKVSEIYGGTNQNAYVLGDTIYASGTNTLARLSGNTTAVKQFLSQTGNGSISAAPIWATLASTDVSDFSEAVDDRVASLLVAGSGISLVYNDPSNTLTINATGTTNNILQNGNSFGTAVTIGSNDAFALNFETSGTTKGTIGTDGVFTLSNFVSNTSTVANRFIIQSNSDGAVSFGFGGKILFQGESSTTDNRDMGSIQCYWATATDGSRASDIGVETVSGGGALTERFRFGSSGTFFIGSSNQLQISNSSITNATSLTVGNSVNPVTIGGSGGLVTISTSAANATAIQINASSNSGSVAIGNTNSGGLISGSRIWVTFPSSITSATSGTASWTWLLFNGDINQSGTATGFIRAVHLNHTITSVTGSYRALEIGTNSANCYGIYQSGSTTQNYFNGNVGLKIDTPAQALDVNGIVRIRSVAGITPTSLVGRDANGDVGAIVLGSGLTLVGDTLTASGGSGTSVIVTEIFIEGQSGTTFDLDANIGEIKDVDGNNVAFTLPSNLSALEVFRNGIKINRTGNVTTRDYSVNISTNIITFVTSLTTDEIITIRKTV